MALHVRELTAEEQTKIERLTRSQSAPLRLVQRAWIIKLSAEGLTVPAIAQRLDIIPATARLWVTRFNKAGLAGLDDAPRPGRPRRYDEGQRSRVIAKARARPPKPEQLAEDDALARGEVPTCHWTLDRLVEELNKDGVPIKRSQIRRILKAEHIKWQKPRSWLESDDPQFAEKRGPSSGSMSPHRTAVRL
ncbi:MAG TPA: helix-turn-helix domain-containing protein [Anaerolineales bacterium]|nr:helix-turn-helix domain-containing protein [Anaerolineales bacterium]